MQQDQKELKDRRKSVSLKKSQNIEEYTPTLDVKPQSDATVKLPSIQTDVDVAIPSHPPPPPPGIPPPPPGGGPGPPPPPPGPNGKTKTILLVSYYSI